MGKLAVGDLVYDDKGNPCHVVAKSTVDNTEQAYLIEFQTGCSIVAGERHLWNVEILRDNQKPVSRVCQTGELFQFTDTIVRIPAADKFPQPDGGYHIVRSITPLAESVNMQCIQVDSASHCYLAGSAYVPTHNSELAAAVALLLTCGDFENAAEVYGCAADKHQASIVFNQCLGMIEQCPALLKRVKILRSQKKLIYKPTNSVYSVLSSDSFRHHGYNTHGSIIDECHCLPNSDLFNTITRGSGDARMQPLHFAISTAGNNTHSAGYELHCKAVDILEGRKVDKTFYPVIYGAKETDSWEDPGVWVSCNPSLGITIPFEKVQDAYESARQSPSEEQVFRQLRLNQWQRVAARWMSSAKWAECSFPVDAEKLKGRVCYGGLDLSTTVDLTALVLCFPPTQEDDKYYVLPFCWLPEETLQERVKRDHVPYDIWLKQGTVMTTPGNIVDYRHIEHFIGKLGEEYNIKEIAADRWNATEMMTVLENMGFTIVPFGQGFASMSPPTKELMKLVLEKRIAHGGNAPLTWCVENVVIKTDAAGNQKPDKSKSSEKIDLAVALIMALDRAIRNGNTEPKMSVYDDRGILLL